MKPTPEEKCECWKEKNCVCDICQKVVGKKMKDKGVVSGGRSPACKAGVEADSRGGSIPSTPNSPSPDAYVAKDHPPFFNCPTVTSPEARCDGLKINCDNCGAMLTEAGALMFSPPDSDGRVDKIHLCKACWRKERSPEARVDWEERLTAELENRIMEVVGEAEGNNGFTIEKWTKKYGMYVLCQVVNELCRQTIQAAYEAGVKLNKGEMK